MPVISHSNLVRAINVIWVDGGFTPFGYPTQNFAPLLEHMLACNARIHFHTPDIQMNKNRLEAFSDGVIAIIITIMVLELKVPEGHQLTDLASRWPIFIAYVLSFVVVGTYWNNHHHLLHATRTINGRVLWANLHFMFWLSLLPFATDWMGESHFGTEPTGIYALILCLCAVSYFALQTSIARQEDNRELLRRALGSDLKGKSSLVVNVLAVPTAFAGFPHVAGVLMALVACLWLVPDTRLERQMNRD